MKTPRPRSIRLTTRGKVFAVAAVLLIVISYSTGNRLTLLVGGLLLGLVAVAAGLARFRSMRLAISRTFWPTPVAARTPLSVSIDTTNLASIRSAPLYWSDTLPWRPLATDAVRLDPLDSTSGRTAARKAKLTYTLNPPRRGVFDIGPLQVAYSDPFGLAVGFMSIGGTSELIVTPFVTELPLNGLWLEAPDGTARLVQATGVGNADDLMTREYRRGDALRRVHWRASARHGELMVRQEEQRAYPEATIVLDTRLASYRDRLEPGASRGESAWFSESFEWGVSMFASLGVHLHRAGFVVHVLESATSQAIELADDEARMGREADFLLSLAGIRLLSEYGRPADVSPAEGPVFAIAAEPDADTLAWLSGIKRPFELGVVFVVGASLATTTPLEEAGWKVVLVEPWTDPALAWDVVAETLGLSRGED